VHGVHGAFLRALLALFEMSLYDVHDNPGGLKLLVQLWRNMG
jgi:hypothetical protein